MTLRRRDTLKLAGAAVAASTVGTAGCLDAVGFGDDGYDRWLAARDEGVAFAYADVAEIDDLEEDVSPDGGGTDPDDPLLAIPRGGAVLVGLAANVALAGTGLDALVSLDDDEADDAYDSTVEGLLVTGAIVLEGQFDVEEVDELLGTADGLFERRYERTDELGDYDLYRPADDGLGDGAVVVSDEVVVQVFDDDPEAVVEEALDAAAGDAERAADAFDGFGWALETAGEGQLVVGAFGEDPETEGEVAPGSEDAPDPDEAIEGVDGADGFVCSLSADAEARETVAEFAGIFSGLDDGTEADLEAVLGASATETSVEIEDGRVTATATWRDEGTE
ncbi:hypothetical protein [Salinilacihabitans rarus]|uniref:hypothetical protein n=1 Tax=Salinilacihabitans rarus TaxID=2961596 RepID=UPI0020C89BF9|nr:hypothetical protein [Salinilacihabitans rarus]